MADFKLGRLKFVWQGAWTGTTAYVKDDVVEYGGSSYVCTQAHTSGGSWASNSAKFDLMLEGGTPTTTQGDLVYRGVSANTRLPIGTEGEALIVKDGIPQWLGLTTAQSIYYVKADGNDANDGSNLNQAFRTIRHACDTVTGPATIYVKGGLYYERLPIKVPANVTIVGDGQRTTGVAPINVSNSTANIVATGGAGATSTTIIIDSSSTVGDDWIIGDEIVISSILAGSGITGTVTITNVQTSTPSAPYTTLTVSFTAQAVTTTDCTISSDYSEGIMWMLNDGATLNKMYFKDMTGFAPNLSTPEDITTATIAGVFIAFDPAGPIVNKSPYVLECAAFGDNAIGAMVDGDDHASGLKSMVFHGYTVISSDGVGYWVNGQGKSEIVSCFTYYCWYGYTTTNGGKIRSLSGNNSYGTYGVIASGFDPDEIAVTGALYGSQITYDEGSLTGGEFAVGNTITGSPSGATGTITNVQTAVNKIYYNLTSGTFTDADTISTGGGSPVTATIATAGVAGQKGFILVADGFSEIPRPGGSVSIAGDTFSYVIQSVSGSYTNSSSVITMVLANEKPASSANNAAVTIRYAYSNARLTGHDFLSIGTGDKISTNYPGEPTQPKSQANEVIESYPGRVFYVSTDQDGNFRVGDYFRVDQATGRATLNASAFDLSGLTSLRLGSIGAQLGELVNEFSSDPTLSGNSNEAVPTEAAVRGYFANIATNAVPVDDDVQTLGTPSKRWNHLYVGDGSITIGDVKLSEVDGALVVKNATTNNPAPAAVSTISNGTSNVAVASNGAVTVTTNNVLALTIGSDGNVTFAGGVTVNGGVISLSATQVTVEDSMLQMALSNPANLLDIGLYGHYTATSTLYHTGFVRDATDNVWKLFSGIAADPTTTVDFTGATYDGLQIGALTAGGTVAVNASGGITTDQTTFPLVNATATTVNFAGAATTINVGASSGKTVFNGDIDIATGKKIKINGTAGTDNKFLKTVSGGLEWADAAVTVSDITTDGTYYPLFTTATTGTVTTASVTSNATTIFSFNPSTGALSAGRKLTLSGSSSGTVSFQAAATAGSTTYTLPSADGTNGYALVTNGSGTLSWAAAGATINDDSSTTTLYPAMSTATSGSLSTAKISSTKFTFNASTGVITTSGGFVESSSIALKENINPITGALDAIMSLVGVTYDRRDGSKKNESGLIAEAVDAVIPSLVSKDANGQAEGIYYSKLTAYLVEAIKDLKSQIDPLKEEIKKLKGE